MTWMFQGRRVYDGIKLYTALKGREFTGQDMKEVWGMPPTSKLCGKVFALYDLGIIERTDGSRRSIYSSWRKNGEVTMYQFTPEFASWMERRLERERHRNGEGASAPSCV